MKEKLQNLIKNIKQPKRTIIIVSALFLFIAGGSYFFYTGGKNDSLNKSENSIAYDNDISIGVVGEDESSILGNTASNNSWPGEVISLNNLQIQPDREGTISEWYVRIGEQVRAGQVIGKLSRPPQTPEAIMALSEKSQMLGEARTTAEALDVYTNKRILQLQQLRKDKENSSKQKMDLIKEGTNENETSSLSLIASKKKLSQTILQGSISKSFPSMFGVSIIPISGSTVNSKFGRTFGLLDQKNLRRDFYSILGNAYSDANNGTIVPEKSGLLYFETAIKLANVSTVGGKILTEMNLESFKVMLIEDQAEFVKVLGEIKSMELERVNTQRESIESLAEIDAMIAELEKELAMSLGDVKAKTQAYATVNGSISGGYSIVAPKNGIISSVMKNPGEFVGPGMPVATVTAGGTESMLVRILVPNNIKKPQSGEILDIIRPGFGTDVQKIQLVGIGSSLEEGSYMADAVFVKPTDWPIGASVRILAPESSSSVLIKYSSILWDEAGIPSVWTISDADRIFAKKITIGRTLGTSVEVYIGLRNGDRYIQNPNPEIKENMFLADIMGSTTADGNNNSLPAKSGKDKEMGGMEM